MKAGAGAPGHPSSTWLTQQSAGRGGGLSAQAALGPGSCSSRQNLQCHHECHRRCLQADGSGQCSWMLCDLPAATAGLTEPGGP